MRVLRLIAVGALIAVGIIAWLSAGHAPTTSTVTESRARSVACLSRAQCIAVGFKDDAYSSDTPFAVLLTDGAWTLRPPPAPSPIGDSVLASIACVPPDICIAVGRQEMPA